LLQHFAKIGVPSTATFASDGMGATPVKYEFWVNGGPHQTVDADAAGTATVELTFTTHRNGLSVEGVGADGLTGYVTFGYYLADGLTAAAEQDSTGDGVPDLLTVGDPTGLGSGLWLAPGLASGAATGRVATPATNLTTSSPCLNGDPSYFDGARLVTGNLMGNNLQDVLVYFVDGPKAGAGVILSGSGDGSCVDFYDGIGASSAYFSDINGDTPIDLANAYNSAGSNFVVPDYIGIGGSPANGYHLTYYPMQGDSPLNIAMAELTGNLTPTGGTDWQNWELFSTQNGSDTAIYLWNRDSGALYLWEGVRYTSKGDYTGTVYYTQYGIAKHWNAGVTFSTIEAVDFTGDGVPDLWTVSPNGTAQAYVVSDLSTKKLAKVSLTAPQLLS
jgi:hypothetical protein